MCFSVLLFESRYTHAKKSRYAHLWENAPGAEEEAVEAGDGVLGEGGEVEVYTEAYVGEEEEDDDDEAYLLSPQVCVGCDCL